MKLIWKAEPGKKSSEVLMQFGAQVRGLQVGGRRPDTITVEVHEIVAYMMADRANKTDTLAGYVAELATALRK